MATNDSRLLDDRRLEGPTPMARYFGPVRSAIAVPGLRWDRAVDIATVACQYWGGAGSLLVPVEDPHEVWRRLAVDAQIDRLAAASREDTAGVDVEVTGWIGTPILSMIAGQYREPREWRPVTNAVIESQNPWHLAYLGLLGYWPERPSGQVIEWSGLRPDVRFEELIGLDHESVAEPGVDDLWRRLSETLTPLALTLFELARRPKRAPLMSGPAVVPDPRHIARKYGGDIVVVYTPQSVADLCLLWNLRAAWDQPVGLPIGIPLSGNTAHDIRRFLSVSGTRALISSERALVSVSVDTAALISIAEELGPRWRVEEPADLLVVPAPIARDSSDVAVFERGRARLRSLSDPDRTLMQRVPTLLHPRAEVRVHPLGRPLPRIASLAPVYPSEDGYRGGAHVTPFNPDMTMEEVRWPSGTTVLAAAARDRGLWCRPSPAGSAASALLRGLGGDVALAAIASPVLIDALHRLAERRGITWYRERARDLAANAPQGVSEAIAQLVDQLRDRPQDDEQVALSYSKVVTLLSRESAAPWLSWAEGARLLIRGTDIRCADCGAKGWRALGELGPPIVCRGCGREIRQPFRPEAITFRYRASEALLNCAQHDSLAHLLIYRWFTELWYEAFDRPSRLYGAYPGVEFGLLGSDAVVGEADIVLLLSSGELIPGEVKRRGNGLNDDELAKLRILHDRLGASWSFVATLSWGDDCPPVWRDLEARSQSSPTFAITGEHVFDRSIIWTDGDNPFAWRHSTTEDRSRLHADFVRDLPGLLDWITSEDPLPYWRSD